MAQLGNSDHPRMGDRRDPLREARRIVYNLVLAAIVLAYFVMGLPATKGLLTVNFVLMLFLLAVLDNVAYCAAYAVDIFAQISGIRTLADRPMPAIRHRSSVPGVITRFWSIVLFNPGH